MKPLSSKINSLCIKDHDVTLQVRHKLMSRQVFLNFSEQTSLFEFLLLNTTVKNCTATLKLFNAFEIQKQ